MTDTFTTPVFDHPRALGKLAPKVDPRTLQLADYATSALPKPPASCQVGYKVPSFPMYGNDSLGDCTCAAVGHLEQAWTFLNGTNYTPAESVIENLYWETGDPPASTGTAGGPTDTGRVEIDVLNYWKNKGVDGHKIFGYTQVNVKNHTLVQQGVWMFGGLYIGIALPLSAQNQTEWSVVNDGADSEPGSWGGHAVNVTAYTSSYIVVVTWGQRLKMTWDFWNKYVDEAYAVLSTDWANSTANLPNPDGFDFTQLEADLAQI